MESKTLESLAYLFIGIIMIGAALDFIITLQLASYRLDAVALPSNTICLQPPCPDPGSQSREALIGEGIGYAFLAFVLVDMGGRIATLVKKGLALPSSP